MFMGVDNFATVSGKKACDMSEVSKFCLEKSVKLNISVIKYALPNLHKCLTHLKLCRI